MNNLNKFLLSTIGDEVLNRYIKSPFHINTNKEDVLFRFVTVSDTHYGLNDNRKPVAGLYQNRMRQIIDNLKNEKRNSGLDFFIGNGDVVHSVSNDFNSPLQAMEEVINDYFNEVGVPFYITPGNHDRINNTNWQNLLGYGRSSSFEFGDFGFILLDSSDIYGSRQVCLDETFLEQKLNDFSNKRGVFFISHIPRFKGEFLPEPNDSPECTLAMNLLKGADNLILASHGHFHYEDNEVVKDGIPVFFDGHSSNYGVNYYGYRIYEVYANKVVTKQWDMDNQRVINEKVIIF